MQPHTSGWCFWRPLFILAVLGVLDGPVHAHREIIATK
jgi:hypothetical protein